MPEWIRGGKGLGPVLALILLAAVLAAAAIFFMSAPACGGTFI